MTTKSNVRHQYLAAFSANILSISFGCAFAWTVASYLDLKDESSPLETGPITKDQLGWVTSAAFPGNLVGGIFFGWLADRIGRKRSLLVAAIPIIIHWIMIPLARNPLQLCIARFLAGVSGGSCFSVIPTYITELAEDRLRSTLGIFLILSLNGGFLLINILGYFLHYITVAWILLAIPIIFLACFIFLPDTPQYLALRNDRKAEKSLRFYRGISSKSEPSEQFNQELIKLCKSEQKVEEKSERNRPTWSDFMQPKARKSFLIGLGLVLSNQLTGSLTMLNYMTVIFKDAGSNWSPQTCSIVVCLIQLTGNYVSMLLIERAGRKTLLLFSTSGICLGEFTMATYYSLTSRGYDTSSFNWIPVAALSFVMFTASCGVLSVVFPVVAEVSPPKLRSILVTVHMSIRSVLATGMVKIFPDLTQSIGMPATIFLYAGFSFVFSLFVTFFVPETKGKTIEEIMESL